MAINYTLYVADVPNVRTLINAIGDMSVNGVDRVTGVWRGEQELTHRVHITLPNDHVATVLAARLAHVFSQDCVLVVRSEVAADRQAMRSMSAYRVVKGTASPTDTAYTVDTDGTLYRYAKATDPFSMALVAYTVDSHGIRSSL